VAQRHLAAATDIYERHGQANSPPASHYFWSEEQIAAALGKTSNSSRAARIEHWFDTSIRDFFPTERALSRRCGRLHG